MVDNEESYRRELQPSNRMYKNYKHYREWVYSHNKYNELKEKYPDEEILEEEI